MAHPPYFANAAVFTVHPDDVDRDPKGRIGLFFSAKAEGLSKLILTNGQNDPIKVVKHGNNKGAFKWKLVAGLHRLEACVLAGLDCYAIEVLGGPDALYAIQASENVDRRELAPLERAMFVHAVAEAAKARVFALHGVDNDKALAAKAKAAKVQYSDLEKADAEAVGAEDNLSSAYMWKAETAEACGFGQKDVQRAIRIYACIVSPHRDLIDKFKDHPEAQNASALIEIAKIKDRAMRRKVIETLIGGPADLDFVLRMLKLKTSAAPLAPYDKWSSQIMSGASKIGTAQWREFCPRFALSMTASRRRELRDALTAAIEGEAK